MEFKSFVSITLFTLCFGVFGVHSEHVMAKRDGDWDGVEASEHLNTDENNVLSSLFESDNETKELRDLILSTEVSANNKATLQEDSGTTQKYTNTTEKAPQTSKSKPDSQSKPALSTRRNNLRFPGNDTGLRGFNNVTNKPPIGLVNVTSLPPGLKFNPPATINPHHGKAPLNWHHPPGIHDSYNKHRVNNLTLPKTVTTTAPKALKKSDMDDDDDNESKNTNSTSESDSTLIGKFTGAIKDFFGTWAKKISRFFSK